MSHITVVKLDHNGRHVLNYPGQVLACSHRSVVLEAYLSRGPFQTGPVTLKPGDRFVEHFYSDRWYNVFELYDRDDDRFKGWYCNVTRPAVIGVDSVAAEDLALDLLVRPDGESVVLDQDEFDALDLAFPERQLALAALQRLQHMAAAGELPTWGTIQNNRITCKGEKDDRDSCTW